MDANNRYQTDLTDRQWAQVCRVIPAPKPGGRPAEYDRRGIANALLYTPGPAASGGCCPRTCPPGGSCTGTSCSGRRTAPSTGSTTCSGATCGLPRVDGVSPRPPSSTANRSGRPKKGPRGYDAGKGANGRKRHILVDALGLVLSVVVHAADIQDRDGARLVLAPLRRRFSRLRLIVADAIDNGGVAEWVHGLRPRNKLRPKVMTKRPGAQTFEVIPFRWRVERTFAWLGRSRRLSKDYEETAASSEAFVKLAMIHLMARRLVNKLAF